MSSWWSVASFSVVPLVSVAVTFTSQRSPIQNQAETAPSSILACKQHHRSWCNRNRYCWHGRRVSEMDICSASWAGRALSCPQRKTKLSNVTAQQFMSLALPSWGSGVWGARQTPWTWGKVGTGQELETHPVAFCANGQTLHVLLEIHILLKSPCYKELKLFWNHRVFPKKICWYTYTITFCYSKKGTSC